MQVEPIRWLRVLLMGLAVQIALMIVVIPFARLGGERSLTIGIDPATLVEAASAGGLHRAIEDPPERPLT